MIQTIFIIKNAFEITVCEVSARVVYAHRKTKSIFFFLIWIRLPKNNSLYRYIDGLVEYCSISSAPR